MDWLSRIVAWLSDHEAAISAVAAILAIAVILFTALRFPLRRRAESDDLNRCWVAALRKAGLPE